MSALDYDLEIEQGSTFQVLVPVLDENNTTFDVSGWSGRGQIRLTADSPDVLYDLTDGVVVATTSVRITIPGADSALWSWREAVYDVELVSPSGIPTRLMQGRVVVSPEVTRSQ